MRSLDRNTVILSAKAQRTSRAAGEKVLPRTGSLRRKVYEYLVTQGFRGAIDQEIETALGIDGNTVRPTRGTLFKDGYIIDSGTTRNNANGNSCIVWRVAQEGMLL